MNLLIMPVLPISRAQYTEVIKALSVKCRPSARAGAVKCTLTGHGPYRRGTCLRVFQFFSQAIRPSSKSFAGVHAALKCLSVR